MGKPAGLIFLILGLVLGPGLYVHARFFTGTVVLEQPLRFVADEEGRMSASASLRLEPAVFPASLVLQFTAAHGPVISLPNTPQNRYRASLFKGGELVQAASFTLQSNLAEATPAIQFSREMSLSPAVEGGDYLLVLVQEGQAEMELTGTRLQLRAGVAQTDPSLLAIGLALFGAGVVMLMLSP